MRRAGLRDIQLVPWLWGGPRQTKGRIVLSGIDVYIVRGVKPL